MLLYERRTYDRLLKAVRVVMRRRRAGPAVSGDKAPCLGRVMDTAIGFGATKQEVVATREAKGGRVPGHSTSLSYMSAWQVKAGTGTYACPHTCSLPHVKLILGLLCQNDLS